MNLFTGDYKRRRKDVTKGKVGGAGGRCKNNISSFAHGGVSGGPKGVQKKNRWEAGETGTCKVSSARPRWGKCRAVGHNK